MIKTQKNNTFFTLSAVAAGVLFSSTAMAVELNENTGLVPSLKLTESYNDNIDDTPDNEKSSWITTVAPGLELIGRDRLNNYRLSYKMDHAIYHSGDTNDKTNHALKAGSHLEFNSRNRLDLNAGYDKKEDIVNDTNRDFFEQGNKYHTYNVGAKYGFGAKAAKMQLDLGLDQKWTKYDNNRDTGSLNREKDHEKTGVTGTAYYRVAPKTRALVEVGYDDYRYDNLQRDGGSLDSENWRTLVGLTWDATAKTKGTAKVGYHEKNFNDADKQDIDGSTWDVSVTWSPLSYSRFIVNTGSSYGEGGSTEDVTDTDKYGIKWQHDWTPRLNSELGYSLARKEYQGSSNDGRKDDLNKVNLGLNYKMREWLELGTGYRYRDNDSTKANSGYTGNEVFVSANMKFN